MASIASTAPSHEASPRVNREFCLGYRPSLDGLRIFLTLPVLPVLPTHGAVQKVGGGSGLYVWHLPIYYLIGRQQLARPLFYLVVIKIAATVAVATLSYYYVERPIQRWAKRRSKARRDTLAPRGT